MLQSRNSRWTAATGVLCVLLLVAAWFLLVGPRRSDAADLRSQRDEAVQANDALQLQIARLKADFADQPAREAELAAIRTQLPGKAELPALIRQIDELAGKAKIELDSLAPGSPVAVDLAGGGAAAPGAAPAAGGAPAAGAASAQAGVLYAIPTVISTRGNYFATAEFLRLVQTSMPRAFLVTGLTAQHLEDAPDGWVGLTLNGQIYVLLDSAAQAGTVTGAVAGATGSTGVSPSPSTTPSPGATGTNTGTGTATGTEQSPAAATPTPTTSASSN